LQNIEIEESNKVEILSSVGPFSNKKASTHIKEIFPIPL
jgi:hypothetical protein